MQFSTNISAAFIHAGKSAGSADGQWDGDHGARLGISGHSLPHAKADLGVDVETALLGLNVLLQGGASRAKTHQCLFRFLQFRFEHTNRLTKFFDFFLQSAKDNVSLNTAVYTRRVQQMLGAERFALSSVRLRPWTFCPLT